MAAKILGGDYGAAAIRVCAVDWSERVPHLAGALGRALARHLVEGRHLLPVRASRALRLTARGIRPCLAPCPAAAYRLRL